ncbi:MAG: DUF3307 domain-containing protein [Chloroflexota bacterium]
MTDIVLVLAWLVLAHLLADFAFQNDWIALNKGQGGRTGALALATHGFHVTLCLVPAMLAFGAPGILYVAVVVASHMGVDAWKVRATRRANADAVAQAELRRATGVMQPGSGLGDAWTPWPGILFLLDQLFHGVFAIGGWLVILAGVAFTPQFRDLVNAVLRDADRTVVHAVVLAAVVVVSLFIVNTRGGYYLVMAMISPRAVAGDPAAAAAVPAGAEARISATVVALERLLIVAAVLAGAELLAVAVLAIDALVRVRRLDDRGFVDWYLVTQATSVLLAVVSALVARGALATLGG